LCNHNSNARIKPSCYALEIRKKALKSVAFKRNPLKIFYGWWIVGGSFLTALYIGGVVFYGFTAFFEPIAQEMDWSYTQISLAASLRGLEMGIFAPLVGMLADRWGPRRLIFGGAIITAAGLFLLSSITSLGMFYLAFALIALGMSASTVTVLMTAVANWFHRRIGIASGIAICGFGFSGLLVPVIVRLIALYEWRITLTILALGTLLIVIPLSFLFRHKPEDYGNLPDGKGEEVTEYSSDSSASQAVEVEVKAKQALRSGAFWRLTLSFMYHMMVVTAVVTHVMPYLSSIGVGRSTSGMVAAGIPLISIFGRLGLGWLGDMFDRKLVTAGSFAVMGLGVICFGYASASGAWILVLFLVLFGIGYGGGNSLRPALGREYFGRSEFGTIFGLIIGIGAVGGIAGPTLAGWAYDNWGSYQVIWLLLGGISFLPVISALTIRPVKSPVRLDGNP